MRKQPMLSRFALFGSIALLLVACGGSDDDTSVEADDAAGGAAESTNESTNESTGTEAGTVDGDIEDMVDDLEDVQASQGGGSATLIVGDQEWTFESVLCAFGEDMIGQEGAVFNLSSIQDGMQLYASIDSYGHSLSLDDIEDFENPSVSLGVIGGGEFITLDGKMVSADAEFVDGTSDSMETVPGTFEATCP